MTRGARILLLAVIGAVLVIVVGVRLIGSDDDTASVERDDAECRRATNPDWSVARTWNEALLEAVRLDVPAPTVHSRNLFHTSAAMWDAWAAFDPVARGVFVDEKVDLDRYATVADLAAARNEAISHAAYGILVPRYLLSPGAEESVTGFDRLMDDLCHDRAFTSTEGDSAAALGNRIAAEIIAASVDDGSNEADGYADRGYEPVNEPLVVAESGTTMRDPNRWQPLEIQSMVAQNGTPLDETVQTFVGSQWGQVTPFAIELPETGPALDPGPPPRLGDPVTDEAFRAGVVEVIRFSASLDPDSPTMIDLSPRLRGNAPLDGYEETGYENNPVTGAPYEPNVVSLGDYGRVAAEYWADGPSSETPPGHWNTIANAVTDALGADLRIGGAAPAIAPLEWDVKLYLSLNGAVHDAAIAGWGAKRSYDYARPISMIRYMGGAGQSSDPDGPSYDTDGLPLEPGLIEIVTEASSAPGGVHEALAGHVGEIAVRSWRGTPAERETEIGGVGWVLAVDWIPYQLPTFVTPAFAAYISGHSTFSMAAAEVLTEMTGSEFFPGGLGEWTIPAGSLEFEAGPDDDITLQWATYADAAAEAGQSRLYGGIHVRADDLAGRAVGRTAGERAWALAQRYFDGTVDE